MVEFIDAKLSGVNVVHWKQKKRATDFALIVFGIGILLSATGCPSKRVVRSDRAKIAGKVTLQGSPVKGGTLFFTSAKDPTLTTPCTIRADGTYMIDNAPLGELVVAIETKSIKTGAPDRYVEIPAKYESAQTSGLTTTANPGENTDDFNLD